MKNIIFTAFILISAAFIGGCSEQEEAPPLSRERTQLILRLFDSMKKNDKASVIVRAEKLQQIAPNNNYITLVLESQTANTYVTYAQKALDEGHEKLALDILQKGLQKHPMNSVLQKHYDQLKMLCDIDDALKKGTLKSIPSNLYTIPEYGPRLFKKMQSKNIPIEHKE